MKEIGGYFELELTKSIEYHSELLKLNSGRNAFKYILKVRNPKKVFIPNFICDSVLEPLEELKINYEFFNIDENFEIVQDVILKENEMIFYLNYFALKSKYIEKYWNEVLDRKYVSYIEKDFVNRILPLPVDQRYDLDDMKRIVEIIKDSL